MIKILSWKFTMISKRKSKFQNRNTMLITIPSLMCKEENQADTLLKVGHSARMMHLLANVAKEFSSFPSFRNPMASGSGVGLLSASSPWGPCHASNWSILPLRPLDNPSHSEVEHAVRCLGLVTVQPLLARGKTISFGWLTTAPWLPALGCKSNYFNLTILLCFLTHPLQD